MANLAPIRYLDAATVEHSMPSMAELVDLAAMALRSLIRGAAVPPKAAIQDDATGVFAHAMPAHLTASEVPGGGAGADLLGMKWIAGGSRNRAVGLPALTALIILSDTTGGAPVAIMDGGVVTAARTAALSGVAARLLAGRHQSTGPMSAALIGAGVQARAHATMLGAVLEGIELTIYDRHPDRSEGLAEQASRMPGVARATGASSMAAAVEDVDIVITATSLGASEPVLGAQDVRPGALVIPVDYGACVRPDLVARAAIFAVDDRDRFVANRSAGRLAGWPDPTATLGELLLMPRARADGLAVALHQGPGIADVIVADAVYRRAVEAGLGVELGR